jgi:hypothetical protein
LSTWCSRLLAAGVVGVVALERVRARHQLQSESRHTSAAIAHVKNHTLAEKVVAWRRTSGMAVTAEKITRARCSQQPLTRHHTPAEWVTTTTTHPPPHTSRVGDKATYFSITRLSAACASFVMASASSRITSLTPLVNTLRVDANVLIVSRTTSILRQRHDRRTSKASATQQVNNAPHVILLAGSVKGREAVSCAVIGFVA